MLAALGALRRELTHADALDAQWAITGRNMHILRWPNAGGRQTLRAVHARALARELLALPLSQRPGKCGEGATSCRTHRSGVA